MPAASTPSRSGDGCQSTETVRALGFTRAGTPTVSTLHEVFKTLDVAAFEGALARWAQAALAPSSHAIALAGKMLRGIHGEELPGVRLVALYDVETGLALTQQGVRTAEETAEGKQEAELSVAPALLRAVALAGRVVTGGMRSTASARACGRCCGRVATSSSPSKPISPTWRPR